MKKTLTIAIALCAFNLPLAHASDEKFMLPIADAMGTAEAKEKLGTDVRFYFGKQKTPKVLQNLGEDKTSKKTNGFGKSKETSCNRAFLSAMIQLHSRARELGANAVINIVSNYKNVPNSSETEFECHDGAIMSGVALKAEFVKLAD
jgi:uncharacterized protein YbjQ (UPF0145 family)